MNMPGPDLSSQTHDAISRCAVDYFQRRRFWEWNDADQAELDAWLAESVLHRAAYLRIEGIVAHTEELAALRPSSMPGREGSGDDGKPMYRRLAFPLLAAASIALMAAAGIPFVRSLMQPPDRVYSTDVGGRTLLKFADGTEIELNTDTTMRFRMTTAERTVWLEKGEGWFHVSHDAANPFTVIVGRHRVTDLGTEFFVRRGSDRMEVALLNGRASLGTEGAPVAMLTPGDDAVAMRASMKITRKTPQELADELAWRRGVLLFRKTRLVDVVREFNRYNTTKLVIADPSISDETISADLRTNDFESFLRLAEASLNLRADRKGNEILISREKTRRAAHVGRSSSEAAAQ